MSGTNPTSGRGDPIASEARPLPSTPSLEYERKEAKALLKRIRVSDPSAVDRVRLAHPVSLRDRKPGELQLADAQHVIAREYGFTSWPRLVEYFEELERHRSSPRHNSGDEAIEHLEQIVGGVIRRHQGGDPIVAREISHFVPRLYGRTAAEILATPITEDEARLVVARERRRGSWGELVERVTDARAWRDRRVWEGDNAPLARARRAVRAHDIDALAAILDEHPELLTPSVIDREWRNTLVSIVVSTEYDARTPQARRLTDFVASRGADVQRELDQRLLGWNQDRENRVDRIRWYLERGANPGWMPPNGFTVLEHAIARHANGASIDLIAEHVTPRRALWIAAGLNDVRGVRSFIAGNGKLTPDGRMNRPDLMAMGHFFHTFPPNHEADDLEVMWEAFRIAGWNERWAAMDALLDAGLPIDHAPMGWSLVAEAVGNMLVPLAEYLISRGADLDREWPSFGSARSLARRHAGSFPQDENARRLLALCAVGSVQEAVAEREAKRPSPPPPDERTLRAMQLAADDAARQGQPTVTTENVLIGVLRVARGAVASVFMGTGVDMSKLRVTIGERLLPDADPLVGQDLAADAGAAAALQAAAAEADARRRHSVSPHHLLHGILGQPHEPGARLLADVWESESRLRGRLEPLL